MDNVKGYCAVRVKPEAHHLQLARVILYVDFLSVFLVPLSNGPSSANQSFCLSESVFLTIKFSILFDVIAAQLDLTRTLVAVNLKSYIS